MAENKETKEIVEAKKAKAPRAKKEPKTVPAKKLPGVFKKKYSEKAFNRKVLKKIFIDSDQKMVQKLYALEQDAKGRNVYVNDLNREIEKKTVDRLKIVAKQMKKQKMGIKFVPLLAVVIFVTVVGCTVTLFKNVILKKVIVSSMQEIFLAETDIAKVDLQIFKASLQIKGLEQTNRNNPTSNIFSIDNIQVNFILKDLLKGKFHAEKLAVEGVAIGSQRKKEGRVYNRSGKLAKAYETVIIDNSKKLAGQAVEKLKAMFASYSPEVMLSEIQENLKSPALANSITEQVKNRTEFWTDDVARMEKNVTEFSDSVQKVVNTDWSKVDDPASIKQALETINSAITKGKGLSDEIISSTSEIKADAEKIAVLASDIQNAITSDKDLIEKKISDVTHLFTKEGMSEVMNDAIMSILYDVTGKYYPYAVQIMDMVKTSVVNKPESKTETTKKKKPKKEKRVRMKGQDIFYRAETVPKLLIDEVLASGYEQGTDQLLFSGKIRNITSDQNMINKNTSAEADFKIAGKANNASVILDVRSNSENPLIMGNYNGKGYPISADAEVFKISSNSDITAMMSIDDISNFSVSGILDMNVTEMTGMSFEPAIISNIYQKTLSEIKYLTLGFGISVDDEKGLSIEIKNMDKLAKQLTDPLMKALTAELTSVAVAAKDEAIKLLSEKTGIATEQIAQFTDISNAASNLRKMSESYQAQLEAKQKELTDKLTAQTKNAVTNTVQDTLKNSGIDAEKAKEALKGLKGLKF